jgi:hypothetical protein
MIPAMKQSAIRSNLYWLIPLCMFPAVLVPMMSALFSHFTVAQLAIGVGAFGALFLAGVAIWAGLVLRGRRKGGVAPPGGSQTYWTTIWVCSLGAAGLLAKSFLTH